MLKPVLTADLVILGKGLACYAPDMQEADARYQGIFCQPGYDRLELPARPVVFDVGANIGLFSLFVKERWPDARIHAFEPVPTTADYLRRNVQLHELSDVMIRQVALGDRTVARTAFAPDQYWPPSVAVRVGRLSSYLNLLPRVDLLRVDVAGAELGILQGIDDVHWNRIDHIVLVMQDVEGGLAETWTLLESRGFAVEVDLLPRGGAADVGTHLLQGRRVRRRPWRPWSDPPDKR